MCVGEVIDHCGVFAGVVRPTQQRGHQGGQPVRERPTQKHDPTGPGEPVQPLRAHHHFSHSLRQYHR